MHEVAISPERLSDSTIDSSISPALPRKPVGWKQLYRVLVSSLASEQVHPNIIAGVNRWVQGKFTQTDYPARLIAEFIYNLSGIMGGSDFSKSTGFNYLTDQDLGQSLTQATENAQRMVGLVGQRLYRRDPAKSSIRETVLKAPLGDGFALTLKGGSGAGTFSLDFAVGVEREDWRNRGELWRTGFDTETLPDGGIGVRIVRTGGVKPTPDRNKKFDEFKHVFRMSPARALTILLVNWAQKHVKPDVITALTTCGAQTLSTLPTNNTAYDYSCLYRQMGFSERDNYWLVLNGDLRVGKREIAGVDKLAQASTRLIDRWGQPLSLS